MKKLTSILLSLLSPILILSQVSGNIHYSKNDSRLDNNINVGFPRGSDLVISVKGLANIKANAYVAIFSVTQNGKSSQEVNRLIDERINQALNSIQSYKGIETYVDMISFVPLYEYNVEKKIFSKNNYTEIPIGFELKKNIHIKYSNPDILSKIIMNFANAEIYDLVKVDYFSDKLAELKKQLSDKAKHILNEKIKHYNSIVHFDKDSIEQQVVDDFIVVSPIEQYKQYNAYSSTDLQVSKFGRISQAKKTETIYYQAISDKNFDFVINPIVLEPVIQVMYQIKLRINKLEKTSEKEYYIINTNGELKEVNINNN